MNLKKDERAELNQYLRDMDLPPRRKKVDANGANYLWLRKNVGKNNHIPDRVKELLCIK